MLPAGETLRPRSTATVILVQRSPLTRRHALAAIGATAASAVIMSGCRSQGSATVEAGDAATLAYRLVAAYPTSIPYVAAGTQVRLPFQLAGADGQIIDDLPDPFEVRIWRDNQPVGDAVAARPQSDGISTYLTLLTQFDTAVDYELRAEFDGVPLLATVRVARPEMVATPPVGAVMPSTATATNDATLDVDPICTLSPECPWHAVSLDAALGSGSPVALIIGSNVYCLDDRCGPSLRNFVAVAGEFPTVTAIHAEPFRNPKVGDFPDDTGETEVTKRLGVEWEPATFFVDRSGIITARADGIVGSDELRSLFAQIA
jgi:hypothetical protein